MPTIASSSTARKHLKTIRLSDVIVEWGLAIARAFIIEHNATDRDRAIERLGVEVVPIAAYFEGSLVEQRKELQLFNDEVEKKNKVEEILTKIDHSKYVDFLLRRFSLDPIVKVRCPKPKEQKIRTMHLTRRDSKGEYPKKIRVSNLVKYGYSKWLEIHGIIKKHKGIHVHELKLTLILM